MLLLLLSLLAFLIGPLGAPLLARWPQLIPGLDAFVLVNIGGLVVLHIVPHSMHNTGWIALVAALWGLLIPWILHQSHHLWPATKNRLLIVMGLFAMGLHAFFDGVGLIHQQVGMASTLAIAVVLHRLLEGLGIWWLMSRSFGKRTTLGVLALMSCGNLAGFVSGRWAANTGLQTWVDLIQVMVAGSLLHVVVHPLSLPMSPLTQISKQYSRAAFVIGGLLATCCLLMLERLSASHEHLLTDMLPMMFTLEFQHHAVVLCASFALCVCISVLAFVYQQQYIWLLSCWLFAFVWTFVRLLWSGLLVLGSTDGLHILALLLFGFTLMQLRFERFYQNVS